MHAEEATLAFSFYLNWRNIWYIFRQMINLKNMNKSFHIFPTSKRDS